MATSVADLTHVRHLLLLLSGSAAAAELLQMAFAASELAIADVEQYLDLPRFRLATWNGVLGVQTSGRLHKHYALKCRAIAAGPQRKHACSGRIVSIAEKVACLFDKPMTLSVLRETMSTFLRDLWSNSRLDLQMRGRGLYHRASCACRRRHGKLAFRVHVCLLPAVSI